MKPLKDNEAFYGLLFIFPVLLGFILFLLGPMIAAIGYSFTDWTILSKDIHFIGFENYKKILLEDTLFRKVVNNTIVFTLGLVPLNLILSLALAEALKTDLPGIRGFRTAIFTPVVTTVVVWGIIWKFIFATNGGLVNMLLQEIGLEGPAWLFDKKLTMPTVIFVSTLKNVGINMTILLAALFNVPQMYYEAAEIEGAGKLRRYFNITLPLISPTIFMVVIITVIGSLKIFSQVYVMTKGGPNYGTMVWVYYIYEKAFRQLQMGYASAVAVLLFLVILVLTMVQWKMKNRWVHYED